MSWIEETKPDRASGLLKRELDAAQQRAGRVWNIVQVMSVNPEVLRASMTQYRTIMYGPGPLSRFQRELLATVVAAEVGCFY